MRYLSLKPRTNLTVAAALAYDTAMAATAMFLSLWLPMASAVFQQLNERPAFVMTVIGAYAAVSLCVYLALGQYKSAWRYTSIVELTTLLKSASATVLIFLPVAFLATRADDIPRTSIVLVWILHIALLAGPRLVARLLFKSALREHSEKNAFWRKIPVLLVGAGPQAQQFLRALRDDPNPVYQIVGVISADQTLPKSWALAEDLRSIPLLGTFDQFPQVLKQIIRDGVPIRHLILSDAGLKPATIQGILPASSSHGITLLRVRPPEQTPPGHAKSEVVPLPLQDVLPRSSGEARPSVKENLLNGRRVLITGAGGTIGTELARQAASAAPARIGLLEKSEFNLFSIDDDLKSLFPAVPRETILCDVRDAAAVDRWFAQFQPEIVFHTAALKHVPMGEAHPLEAILTNVEGTRIVADACMKYGAKAMVLVSSDKAVNPTSIIGVTKRLSEMYCQALDLQGDEASAGTTRFITVRFGNVLWSSGSVVTRFRRQLAEGIPLTVTHPDVVRYFMTIDEAVDLIFLSCDAALKPNFNRGTISVLNMGAPIRILDLARTMTMLAGKRPDTDVPIQYIGLRPGEKLSEDLVHQAESMIPSFEDGILLAAPRTSDIQFLRRDIVTLVNYAREGDLSGALRVLQTRVPEYQPARNRKSGDNDGGMSSAVTGR